jgi:hypothetical protein
MISTHSSESVARNASRRPGATFAVALQAVKAGNYELAQHALECLLDNGKPLPSSACYLHPTGNEPNGYHSVALRFNRRLSGVDGSRLSDGSRDPECPIR